ncbi:MAG: GNAT family N-acetyltransferase [Cyanobacteria bacterium P01_D01_bin.44]
MNEITPPESVHALDLGALRARNITFWSGWQGDALVGCGVLKELDASSGEIKSMRTAKTHRGRGIASRMLEHIIQVAERRAYNCLYLKTGAMPEFAPARALYTRYGLEYRGPFTNYTRAAHNINVSSSPIEQIWRWL